MDITEDICNDRSSSFVTLDHTMLSSKPLLAKPNQPLTTKNSDHKSSRDMMMNISKGNLDLLENTFNMSKEGTFLVTTLNSKKTPTGAMMNKVNSYRTIEEAKV